MRNATNTAKVVDTRDNFETDSDLLSTDQAARLLYSKGITTLGSGALATRRNKNLAPIYVRAGHAILYRRGVIEKFAKEYLRLPNKRHNAL
jgi:hypothetical protein